MTTNNELPFPRAGKETKMARPFCLIPKLRLHMPKSKRLTLFDKKSEPEASGGKRV